MWQHFFATCVLFVCITAPLSAVSGEDVPAPFRADILELMQLTGAANIGVQLGSAVAQQFIAALRQAQPNIPPRAVEITNEVVGAFIRKGAEGQLLEEVIPIYAKHFTQEDIRDLLAFYRTPIGQKAIAAMPTIVTESMRVGQVWAQQALPTLQEELKKRLTAEGLLQQ